jgi:hypothetical protein
MKIDLTLPSGWHQVEPGKLVQLARLFLSHCEKSDFLARCFFLFSGWKLMRRPQITIEGKKQYWFKKGFLQFYIDADRFTFLVKKLEWITEGIALPAGLPEIKGFSHVNHRLYYVTLETFLEADNYYQAYIETQKFSYINQLFQQFYHRQRLFAWPSKAEKYAVFLWFTGVKSFLAIKYPYIFTGSSGSEGGTSPEETILNLLSALNQGDVTNNKKIFKTHVHECFHELNLKIEHAPKTK